MKRFMRWLKRQAQRLAARLYGTPSPEVQPGSPVTRSDKARHVSTCIITKTVAASVTAAVHVAGIGGNIATSLTHAIEWASGWRLEKLPHHLENTFHALAALLHIDDAHEIVAAVERRPKHWLETVVRWISNAATTTAEILKLLAGTPVKDWLLSLIPSAAVLPSAPLVVSIASAVIIGAAALQLGLLVLRLTA